MDRVENLSDFCWEGRVEVIAGRLQREFIWWNKAGFPISSPLIYLLYINLIIFNYFNLLPACSGHTVILKSEFWC